MNNTIRFIKNVLAARNMTQRELAQMCGYSEATVSRWLNGNREPRISDCERMVDALGYNLLPHPKYD